MNQLILFEDLSRYITHQPEKDALVSMPKTLLDIVYS